MCVKCIFNQVLDIAKMLMLMLLDYILTAILEHGDWLDP